MNSRLALGNFVTVGREGNTKQDKKQNFYQKGDQIAVPTDLVSQRKSMRKQTHVELIITKHIRKVTLIKVFENHRKSLIQHCERSGQKLLKNTKNGPF